MNSRNGLRKPLAEWVRSLIAPSIGLAVAVAAPRLSSAQVGFEDESPVDSSGAIAREREGATAAALDRASRRLYAGGRDEQELKVQPTLPTPSRSSDGGGAPGGSAPRSEPAPD